MTLLRRDRAIQLERAGVGRPVVHRDRNRRATLYAHFTVDVLPRLLGSAKGREGEGGPRHATSNRHGPRPRPARMVGSSFRMERRASAGLSRAKATEHLALLWIRPSCVGKADVAMLTPTQTRAGLRHTLGVLLKADGADRLMRCIRGLPRCEGCLAASPFALAIPMTVCICRQRQCSVALC